MKIFEGTPSGIPLRFFLTVAFEEKNTQIGLEKSPGVNFPECSCGKKLLEKITSYIKRNT